MHTPADILDIIDTSVLWKPEENGFLVWIDQSTSTNITKEELDAVDNRLYPVIHEMIRTRANDQYGPEVLGPLVKETLSEWQCPSLVIQDHIAGLIHVTDIRAVRALADNSAVVWEVTRRELDYLSLPDDAEPNRIPYVSVSYRVHAFTDVSWLSTQYPGWETRLAAMDAIGLAGDEKAAYLLSKQETLPTVDMAEVRFD